MMEIDNEENSSLYTTSLYASDKMECSDIEEASAFVSDQYSRQLTTTEENLSTRSENSNTHSIMHVI